MLGSMHIDNRRLLMSPNLGGVVFLFSLLFFFFFSCTPFCAEGRDGIIVGLSGIEGTSFELFHVTSRVIECPPLLLGLFIGLRLCFETVCLR